MRTPLLSSALLASALCAAFPACSPAEEIEAVSSRVSSDYVRTRLPDGSFKVETYAFGRGGYWSGAMNDKTIDTVDFLQVAHTIARPLAGQSYLPSRDPNGTNLLIMVYWGTTRAPEHASNSIVYQNLQLATQRMNTVWSLASQHDRFGQSRLPPPGIASQMFDEQSTAIAAVQAEGRIRDLVNRQNAAMLGYESWWSATYNAPMGSALEIRKQDMINELEGDRYFVVLMAYDFRSLQHDRRHKLLWETRFSISEHRNAFDKQLESMALYASRYFGQDSHGLTHRAISEGHVDVGEVKSLGTVAPR